MFISLQEQIHFLFSNFFFQAKSMQTAICKILFGASSLPLRKYTKQEFDVTLKASKFLCNPHDQIIFPFFVEV